MVDKIGNIEINKDAFKTERKPKQDLGKDEFLQLLIAGMKYQDPMEPAKNEDFIAQTAQFTSLEQQKNLNDSMQQFMNYQSKLSGINLIGRSVNVQNNLLNVKDDAAYVDVNYSTKGLDINPDETVDLTVEIRNFDGTTVKKFTEEGVEKDKNLTFQWNKKDDIGNEVEFGSYEYFVTAKMPNGEEIAMDTYSADKVVSVNVRDGNTTVKLSNGDYVDLNAIIEVE